MGSGVGLVAEKEAEEEEFEAEELARESDGESRGLWGDTGSGKWGLGKNCGDLGVGVVGKRGLCCMGMMGGRARELGPGVGLVAEKEAEEEELEALELARESEEEF